MAILSLLPLVGAILVWGPVAVYYLASGAVGKGLFLAAYGFLAIGMIDNILRPLLVRKETRLPDYLVLISTFGGLAVFGINGFIIGPVVAALFVSVWDIFQATRSVSA
jgi:predicted PurR-regulated permease PerM